MSRVKYPVKRVQELTDDDEAFIARVAEHLTAQQAKPSKRGVSKNAVTRQMIRHCQTCPLFLDEISMPR